MSIDAICHAIDCGMRGELIFGGPDADAAEADFVGRCVMIEQFMASLPSPDDEE